jgi:hypothetical protein
MTQKMTSKQIKNYLVENYGECRHDPEAMSAAINDISEELGYEDKFKLFLLLVENKPIDMLYTHSYGFHTSNGREIINKIKEYYYGYESIS